MSDKAITKKENKKKNWRDNPEAKDWTRACENCGQKPVVNITGLCGPCTWGEAETINGNW